VRPVLEAALALIATLAWCLVAILLSEI